MKPMTFGIVGNEVDLLAQKLLVKCIDPRDTLELSLVLERLWEEMRRTKTDLQELLKKY